MRRRLGILGGTFDPPHIGHLAMAVEVRDALALDVVLMVVAHVPWQKAGGRVVSPSEDRLALVEAAVADLDGVEASDVEIRRGGPSYTADTLVTLAAAGPDDELWVILGADAAAGLSTWERGEEVADRARIAVAEREGETGSPPPGWSWRTVPITRLDVSSTDLRERVAAGRTIDVLVPSRVRAEIATVGASDPSLAPLARRALAITSSGRKRNGARNAVYGASTSRARSAASIPGASVRSGSPGPKVSRNFTRAAPSAATARPVFSSSVMFPRRPWCLEMTSAVVQCCGRVPSSRNSIGSVDGSRLASSTYALMPRTKAPMIAAPRG